MPEVGRILNDFKGELKHLKAKSPGLTSAVQPSLRILSSPNMLACGLISAPGGGGLIPGAPTACSSGRNGDLCEGRNKAECAVEWGIQALLCPIIYRGSGSSPLLGPRSPHFHPPGAGLHHGLQSEPL